MIGRAEYTGLPGASFHVVAAGQCWHWFDRPKAAAEARRLLARDGMLVIAHFDWIPMPGNVAAATERLVEKNNSEWKLGGGLGIYPAWLRDAAEAGFVNLETFSYDVHVPYSHESWRGRIRACAGVGASLGPSDVARFDEELKLLLERDFPEPLRVLHRVSALVCQAPSHERD